MNCWGKGRAARKLEADDVENHGAVEQQNHGTRAVRVLFQKMTRNWMWEKDDGLSYLDKIESMGPGFPPDPNCIH